MVNFSLKAWRLFMWICLKLWNHRNQTHNIVETHVTLDAIAIHRYVLSLHRNALTYGEKIIFHTSIRSIIKAHNAHHSRYHTMAYDECFYSFGGTDEHVTLLDPDYFQSSHHYRIPIGFHPLFVPPASVSIDEKKAGSIQFLGNTEPMYEDFDSEFWKMPTRVATMKLIKSSHPELGLETSDINKYRKILLETQFFISLPGVSMPLCHNFYESLICGCIPLLNANYAKWLDPELQSLLKPVTYHTDEELLNWITHIKTGHFLSHPKELAMDLMAHCERALSWKTIKSSIRNSERALISAEEISVKLAMDRLVNL